MQRLLRCLALLPGLLSLAACTGDFTPYNEIDRLRVLAIGADRPWLASGDSTELHALVVTPDDAPVSYRWSWCPFTQGANQGYECALTQEELQMQIDQAAGAPGLLTVPSFELGTSTTAVFAYNLPSAFFEQVCAAIQGGGDIPDFVELPACDGTFPITIRLHVESGGLGLDAVKQIFVLYQDQALNTNPRLDGLSVVSGPDVMTEIVTSTAAPLRLKRGVDYELKALVPLLDNGKPADAQSYEYTPKDGSGTVPLLETLVFTWFIEAGEMKFSRTGFIDPEVTIESAQANVFTTPKKVDYDKSTDRLFLVIQDNRKGVSWITRTFELED